MTHEIRGVRVEKYALLCQQTSPKRWFGNMDMTSNCDVTKSAHQIQMTTIWPLTQTPHENFLRTPLAEMLKSTPLVQLPAVNCRQLCYNWLCTGADPASKFSGAISVIFCSQVSLRVDYCKRRKVYFTTLLWQNNGTQMGLISPMVLSELYKIMVKNVNFVSFRGGNRSPLDPPLALENIKESCSATAPLSLYSNLKVTA